jgi:hypothetical protein
MYAIAYSTDSWIPGQAINPTNLSGYPLIRRVLTHCMVRCNCIHARHDGSLLAVIFTTREGFIPTMYGSLRVIWASTATLEEIGERGVKWGDCEYYLVAGSLA